MGPCNLHFSSRGQEVLKQEPGEPLQPVRVGLAPRGGSSGWEQMHPLLGRVTHTSYRLARRAGVGQGGTGCSALPTPASHPQQMQRRSQGL